MLAIHENGVTGTISIDRAALVPFHNAKPKVSDGRRGTTGETAVIENDYQARDDKVWKRERFDTEETNMLLAPAASGNIAGQEPGELNKADGSHDEVDIREYAVEEIFRHTQGIRKTYYVNNWYGYPSYVDMVKPSESFSDWYSARYWVCIGKRARAANDETNKKRWKHRQKRTEKKLRNPP